MTTAEIFTDNQGRRYQLVERISPDDVQRMVSRLANEVCDSLCNTEVLRQRLEQAKRPDNLDHETKLMLNRRTKQVLEHGLRPSNLMSICVLQGAEPFEADIWVQLHFAPMWRDSVRLRSYGDATVSSGEVQIVKDLACDPRGMICLVFEDIIDSGLTMQFWVEELYRRGALLVIVCTMLWKSERTVHDAQIDHHGFEIPNYFAIGYGMDYEERHREEAGVYEATFSPAQVEATEPPSVVM